MLADGIFEINCHHFSPVVKAAVKWRPNAMQRCPSRFLILKALPMSNNPIVAVFGVLLLCGIINFHASASTTPEQTLAKVQEVAHAQLQKQADSSALLEPQFALEVVRTAHVLPVCPSEVTVESLDTRSLNRLRVLAVCAAPPGWRYEFVVRAKVSAKVAIAANDLIAGKFLSPSDVLLERHDISGVPDSFSDLTLLDGMSARRTVRAGELLRQNMLVPATVVRRGDLVRIVARREQIEVSMAGEALDNGGRGATVRVRNSSGTIIRARVIEAGTVEPAELPAAN
jgi:flagella basal body P-ring formation protein FlgA